MKFYVSLPRGPYTKRVMKIAPFVSEKSNDRKREKKSHQKLCANGKNLYSSRCGNEQRKRLLAKISAWRRLHLLHGV